MNIDLIPTGDDPPNSVNVVIEVPVGGEPVKYEFDKKSGALFVDRILHTPMRYPANYGFVPHTLSPDGDPLDALVIARTPFVPGSVVRARPIGVLNLEDEHGGDQKLICVPVNSTFPYYTDVESVRTCRRSSSSRSSIFSLTTRTSSRRNGYASAAGAGRTKPSACWSKQSSGPERPSKLTAEALLTGLSEAFLLQCCARKKGPRHGKSGPHLFRSPRRRGAGTGDRCVRPPRCRGSSPPSTCLSRTGEHWRSDL